MLYYPQVKKLDPEGRKKHEHHRYEYCSLHERKRAETESRREKFSNMLNGRTVIRAEHIPPICEALGVEPNDIMKDQEEAQHGKH